MKELMGCSKYHADEGCCIAYLLEAEEDIYTLIDKFAAGAGLEDYSIDEILNDHLFEYGARPTEFPVVVVVDASERYNTLAFTYITKRMFEV